MSTDDPKERDLATEPPTEPPTEPFEPPSGPSPSEFDRAALDVVWYAVPDDTVGGWAVANADRPVSAHSRATGVFAVGDFLSEPLARHVADLHNRWLRQFGPDRD